MIKENVFISQCNKSLPKRKFGIEYVEYKLKKSKKEQFTFLLFKNSSLNPINDYVLDFLCRCHSLNNTNYSVNINFIGYKADIVSLLIKIKKSSCVVIRSINFSIQQQSILYPELFLNVFDLKKKDINKSLKTVNPKLKPILSTLHVSCNNLKVFCEDSENNNLFISNVKMLN